MALNYEYDVSNLPTIDIPRSKFSMPSSHKTTFNVGDLVPIFVQECYPGSTYEMRSSQLVRLQTLLYPLMDNLYLDMYWFFTPSRILWDHFEEFLGANKTGHWVQPTKYSIPQLSFNNVPDVGSIADYMGIPTNNGDAGSFEVSALPFRAYAMIWNEFFRDENLSDPVLIHTDDTTREYTYSDNYRVDGSLGGHLLKVAKYRDAYTTGLPAPQKGDSVTLPIVNSDDGLVPVKTSRSAIPLDSITNAPLLMYMNGPTQPIPVTGNHQMILADGKITYNTGTTTATTGNNLFPVNLFADFNTTDTFSVASINQLRLAFATQRILERDALYGTRYNEIIYGHFGVQTGDARLQRPEFLGSTHIPLIIDQVVQQSSTTQDSPLGDVAGFSVTADTDDAFIYSSVEHGYIIGLCAVRYEHTYQNGIEPFWKRKDRLDFYWPELSQIGEQPIRNDTLYLSGDENIDNEVFAYQEAWYDLRFKPNRVSAEMRSNITNSLDAYHLADDYREVPVLGNDWILEDGNIVDRVISVSQRVSNQVIADFYFDFEAVLPLPVYSIPSIIDMR